MQTCTRSDTIRNLKFEIGQTSKKLYEAREIVLELERKLEDYEDDLEFEQNK